MRCRECNVDLPKEYTACPLCGGKVSDDAPLIEGITLAEYPKVETEKYKPDPFPIFLIVWALSSLTAFVLFKTETVDVNQFSLLVSAVPMVWTLICRPIMVKQLYAGNYAVMNLYPFALGGFIYSLMKGALSYYFLTVLPAVFIAVLVALTVIVIAKMKVCKRAASYFVLSGAVAVVAEIVTAFTKFSLLNGWLIVIAICVLNLLIIFIKAPKEAKEEIKAKFSIQ